MIYILSWTTKKHQKILFWPLRSTLKKIQGLLKDLHGNLWTFQDCANPVLFYAQQTTFYNNWLVYKV